MFDGSYGDAHRGVDPNPVLSPFFWVTFVGFWVGGFAIQTWLQGNT